MPYKDPTKKRANALIWNAANRDRRKTPEAREKARIKMAKWRANNPEKARTNSHNTYVKHQDKYITYQRTYRDTHVDELREKRAKKADKTRIYNAAYAAAHREESRAYRISRKEVSSAYHKAYYLLHRTQKRLYHVLYHAAHPEKTRMRVARRRAIRMQAPVNDFTVIQWEEMKRHYKYRCVYCGKKSKHLTMDHLTSLFKGGSHTKSNIVPCCKSCNSKKSTNGVLKPVQPLLL